MGARIDGDAVRVHCEEAFANLLQVAAMLIEDRNNAALSGDVKATEALIKGKHVGVCANRVNGSHFLRVEIKYCQLCILFAGHGCQTMFAVDVEAVAPTA